MSDKIVSADWCFDKIRDYIKNPQSDETLLEDQKKKAERALDLLSARFGRGTEDVSLVGCMDENLWIQAPPPPPPPK